jgi:hypothetical protein
VGVDRGSLSLVNITEELLERKVAAPGKPRLTAMGIRCADHAIPLSAKVGTNFAEKWWSLDRYNSLAD